MHAGPHAWGWLTSVTGGKLGQLCGGCWELLWLLSGQGGGGKLLLPGSTGPLSRGQGPRACTVWNGDVLGMCAPSICVRPGALLRRIGRRGCVVGPKSPPRKSIDNIKIASMRGKEHMWIWSWSWQPTVGSRICWWHFAVSYTFRWSRPNGGSWCMQQ